MGQPIAGSTIIFLLFFIVLCNIHLVATQSLTSKTIAGTVKHHAINEGIESKYFTFSSILGGCVNPKNGDMYVGDNNRLFKLDAKTNRITHVAGNGYQMVSSTGCSGPYARCGENLLATDGHLRPTSCAYDPSTDQIYVTEVASNSNVKVINATTGYMKTFYGIGMQSSGLSTPLGIAVSSQYVFVADSSNYVIRQIHKSNGSLAVTYGSPGVNNYAGDGISATSSTVRMNTPTSVVLADNDNTLYFADKSNNRIRRIFLNNNTIETYAGTGLTTCGNCGDGFYRTGAVINNPTWISIFNGTLYFTDNTNRIRFINSENGSVYTLAGIQSTTNAYSVGIGGDNQLASTVYLGGTVNGMFSYGSSIYFTESGNNRVREVNMETLILKSVAGASGSVPATNFGFPLLQTSLGYAPKFVYDKNGTLHIVQGSRNEVMKLNQEGILVKIAGGKGSSTETYGNPYYSAMSAPVDILFDQNNDILFADTAKIKKINMLTNTLSLYAGGYASYQTNVLANLTSFNLIKSIALTNEGDLLVVDSNNYIIRKISKSTNIVSVFAGTKGSMCSSPYTCGDGGLATSATVRPYYIAVEKSTGDVYFSEYDNHVIRKINSSGYISLYAGVYGSSCSSSCVDTIPALGAKLYNPSDLQFHPLTGELYFADTGSNRVRKINSTGLFNVIGSGVYDYYNGYFVRPNYVKIKPTRVSFSPSGQLYFDDNNSGSYFSGIRTLDTVNNLVVPVSGFSSYNFDGEDLAPERYKLHYPTSIFIDSNNDIYIGNNGDTTLNQQGNIFMTFTRVVKQNYKTGKLTTVLGNLYTPVSVTASPNGQPPLETSIRISSSSFTNYFPPLGFYKTVLGEYIFSDTSLHVVRQMYANGTVYTIAGVETVSCTAVSGSGCGDGGPALQAQFNNPTALTVGSNGTIYIADTLNNRIRVIENGIVRTIAGLGVACGTAGSASCDSSDPLATSLKEPTGLYLTNDGSTLYIVDTSNHKIRKLSNGIMSVVAGDTSACTMTCGNPTLCSPPDCGTNVIPTKAKFRYPTSLVVDELSGDIYIADQGSNSIRIINSSTGNLTTYAGTPYPISSGYVAGFGVNGRSDYIGSPAGLFLNKYGLYYTEVNNGRLRSITPKCPDGFIGFKCDILVCNNIEAGDQSVCSSHGICDAPNHCNCSTGYEGTNCEILRTCNNTIYNDSSVCNGRGSCVSSEICSCSIGYTGTYCEIVDCFGKFSNESNVCSGHGSCQAINYCSCETGYFGESCELTSCFGKNSTEGDVCSNGNGNCTYLDHCECMTGYFSSECNVTMCNGIFSNDSRVCNSNGDCNSLESCSCISGYFGDYCELTNCFGIQSNSSLTCSSHGNCSALDTCQCQEGFYGDDCSLTQCQGVFSNESNVCSKRGNCSVNSECICQSNYFGSNCELTNCFGIQSNSSQVCSSRGNCSVFDACQCQEGFYGPDCSLTQCHGVFSNESNVCSKRGNCSVNSECICQSNYFGSNCEFSYCFGIQSNSSLTCSSHGNCTALDTCQCQEGFYGPDCSFTKCNEHLSNDTNVCSKRGNCSIDSKCICQSNYFGSNCELTNCFGIQSNSSQVCSSNGNCSSFDVCQCQEGFYGSNCSIFMCNNVYSNDSNSCSKRGLCLPNGNCQCNNGYMGKDCELFQCFGKLMNDSLVCSGNGNCSAPDYCICTDGFNGTYCNVSNNDGINVSNTTIIGNLTTNSNNSLFNNTDFANNTNLSNTTNFNGINNSTFGNSSLQNNSSNFNANNQSTFGNNTSANETFGNNTSIVNHNETQFSNHSNNGNNSNINYPNNNHGNYSNNNFTTPNNTMKHNETNTNPIIQKQNSTNPFENNATCQGLSNLQKYVCSGNGQCVSNNKCKCGEGYFGDNCQIFKCGNFLSNQTNQFCGGKGQCSSLNTCKCVDGFGGRDCSYYKCFGLTNDDSNVCSGRGQCNLQDSCSCSTFNSTTKVYGQQCEYLMCLTENNEWMSSKDVRVCSSHGACTQFGCNCSEGYTGKSCEIYSCFGELSNSSNVCNGKGKCVAPNQCSCFDSDTQGHWSGPTCSSCQPTHYGIDCKQKTCNDTTTCSNHGKCNQNKDCECQNNWSGKTCNQCITNYYGPNCNIYCSSEQTCGGHGDCLSTGDCQCHSSLKLGGYWTGSSCNACQGGFFGKYCSTSFGNHNGTVYFSENGDGIVLKLYAPNTVSSNNVDCKLLISNVQDFGSDPKCYWTNKENGDFKIDPDSDFNQSIQKIKINKLIFDGDSSTDFEEFTISKQFVKPPVLKFKKSNQMYGKYEVIIIDASNSYSGDKKKLVFEWKFVQGNPSQQVLDYVSNFNSSILKFDKSVLNPGTYAVQVSAISLFSGYRSDISVYYFQISDNILPILSIIGKSDIVVETTSVPVTIKKLISFPPGFSVENSVSIQWIKLKGPSGLKFEMDKFYNLIITDFGAKGSNEIVFQLIVTSLLDINSKSSKEITIQTKSPSLELSTYKKVIGDKSIIEINYNDPEKDSESEDKWTWGCTDVDFGGSCGDVITQNLIKASLLKNKTIEINRLTDVTSSNILLSIQILKGDRVVNNNFVLNFNNTPPVINLISMYPSKSVINRQDQFSIHLSIDDKHKNDVDTRWLLNGNPINPKLLSKMKDGNSTSIILDISQLEEGSTNLISFIAFYKFNEQISSSFSHQFTVSRPPKKCPCVVTPTVGFALKTDFAYHCENCQNDQESLVTVFGFIDKVSGVKIPLNSDGEQYSTKIPNIKEGIVDLFVDIIDSETGAYTTVYTNITIITPSFDEIDLILNDTLSQIKDYLNDGDSSKSLYALSTLGSLKSNHSYIVDFIFSLYMQSLNISKSSMKEEYISIVTYGLNTLVKDFIDDNTFTKTTSLINELIYSIDKISLPPGVESLLQDIFAAFAKYLYQLLKGQVYSIELADKIKSMIDSAAKVIEMILLNKQIGEKMTSISNEISSLIGDVLYRKDLANSVISTENAQYLISLPENIVQYQAEKEGLEKVGYVVQTQSNEFASLNQVQIKENGDQEISISKRPLSDQVTFTIIDNPNYLNSNSSILIVIPTFEKLNSSIEQVTTTTYTTEKNGTVIVTERLKYSCEKVDSYKLNSSISCSVVSVRDASSSSSLVTCNCTYESVDNVVVVENKETVKQFSKSTTTILGNPIDGLYALLVLVLLFACNTLGIFVAIICLFKKRKKNPPPIDPLTELVVLEHDV